ncbi:MAG: TRAP transporter small permease [Anaerotignum sp.]|nr:TRAP transporter small permease [Anaerotignum sp.]
MAKMYSKFLDKLEMIEKFILAITSAAMVVIIVYQVFLRYCLHASNAWSEELARYLFIYDVMIAAAIAIRRNSHLQVDFLINLLKPKAKAIFTIIATLVGMVFLVCLFSYSITLCQASMNNISPGVGVSMAIPYASMPIGAVLMILTSIEVILKNIDLIRNMDKEVTGA